MVRQYGTMTDFASLPFFVGLCAACLFCALMLRLLPASFLKPAALLLLLPCSGLAFLLPVLVMDDPFLLRGYPSFGAQRSALVLFLQGFLLGPAVSFPLGRAILRLPGSLTRTAIGLGADAATRVRLLWLPLLLPSFLLSCLLAIFLSFLCLKPDYL